MTAVAKARVWANALVQRESRGAGDMENAMRRLEARYGIPWRVFWSLKYMPPGDVFVGIYERLGAAYIAECERQERLLRHEIEIARLALPPGSTAVGAAETALGGEKDD